MHTIFFEKNMSFSAVPFYYAPFLCPQKGSFWTVQDKKKFPLDA